MAGMVTLHHGDCREVMATLEANSIDAIVTDPPYAEISRDYGRLTEDAWWELMMGVCAEARRVLKPTGSAVFIIQPNMVQDFYWWNHTTTPTVHCNRDRGLARCSVKPCVWAGSPECYRNQDAVLWTASDSMDAMDREDRALHVKPSGQSVRCGRIAQTVDERGGVTPFNLLPIANTDSSGSSGAHGHGAGSPLALAHWWTRYITPPGGTVLDPFCGAGTMGVAATQLGNDFIGIEKEVSYVEISRTRIGAAEPSEPLFAGLGAQ